MLQQFLKTDDAMIEKSQAIPVVSRNHGQQFMIMEKLISPGI
jgi:hypothetical protein